MIPNLFALGASASLRACSTDRFKAGTLSVSSVIPINRATACMAPLLLSVLRRGTEKYPTLSHINRRLDYLWGTAFSIRSFYRGNCQILGFSADLLDASYLPESGEDITDGVLDLMQQLLFYPLLDENGLLSAKYVESEKELQCDAIRAARANPRAYAAERCKNILLENEPGGLSLYGTEEEVMAVTPEELTAYWKELHQTLSFHAFYVGASNTDSVINALANGLGVEVNSPESIEQNNSSIPLTDVASIKCRESEQRVVEDLPVHQSALVLSLRTPAAVQDDGFFAVALYNELLGSSSPVSKLFINVREKLGLCYSCFSTFNAYKAALTICCSLEDDRREEAEAEIRKQIAALAAGDITDEEWQAAQKSMANAYRQLSDSPSAMEVYYLGRALAGVSISPEEGSARIAALTRDEVIQVAKQMKIDTVFVLHPTGGKEEQSDEEI